MPPARGTTQRLRTRVMPTRPTFWAYAVYGKVLKTPPSTVERPSARRPSARECGSTLRSVISPTAIRSPVVSVIVTSATTSIDTIAENSKAGAPKGNGVLIPTQSAPLTPSKSVNPKGTATTRPTTMPTSTAIRLRKAGANRCTPSTTTSTNTAGAMFLGAPKSAEPTPPATRLPSTGSSEIPMVRITVPVTSGGKKRSSLPKTGASSMIARPATITEP